MMPDLSLAHLTVISLAPPQMVDVAALTGFRYVGLRLIAVTPDSPGYPLVNEQLDAVRPARLPFVRLCDGMLHY